MIGVLSKESEKEAVKEFFQLFKTPWQFFQPGIRYDVLLSTTGELSEANANLVIVYGCEKTTVDVDRGVPLKSRNHNIELSWNGRQFPIYGNVVTFEQQRGRDALLRWGRETATFEMNLGGSYILRIGYDLFHEVEFLLSSGQPKKQAPVPTLEIHIDILREAMCSAGIPFVEIPPMPMGYDFIVCLTHDIDFFGIRRHLFDHTMLGFLYRATVGSLIGFVTKRLSWPQLFRNWKAVFSLPFVYLGWCRDFWSPFDSYLEMERDGTQTFFLIPYKKYSGTDRTGTEPSRRASRYDVTDIKTQLKKLQEHRPEIGLHGIDAWKSVSAACREKQRISSVTGPAEIGVRMHWLFFDDHSPRVLDRSGFLYDSTFGYNDAVGFRGGTTQVFRFSKTKDLLELPLNIQDTAMFFSGENGVVKS